jgi:hypothetical protein
MNPEKNLSPRNEPGIFARINPIAASLASIFRDLDLVA